jgi:hypothetical protein
MHLQKGTRGRKKGISGKKRRYDCGNTRKGQRKTKRQKQKISGYLITLSVDTKGKTERR